MASNYIDTSIPIENRQLVLWVWLYVSHLRYLLLT